MNVLVPLPVILCLVGAGLSMACYRRVAAQRVLGLAALGVSLAAAVAVLVRVERDGPVAVDLGGWPAPVGITYVADLLSALLLVISLATVLCVLVFAVGQEGADASSRYFHPVYLVLTAGVAAAFLTGDLFHLFVAFELLLAASYVLITLGGRRDQVRTGMTYVVINILASTLFLAALALLYAATGTVNMAELVRKLADLPDGVRTALGVLFFVVFGLKAAIFPLFSWLPDSYPTAPAPVTAIFAGLLTKVGVYAIIRSQTMLFGGDGAPGWLILTVAGLTMVVGVLGAIAQDDMKRILSFHIVSQIGYMVLGIGLFTVSGVAGAVFFVIHQIPVKASLFLVSGMVEHATGTAALHSLGGLLRRLPVVAALFGLAALSLAGMPPLSGFPAKLGLVEAGFTADAWVVTGVSLAVSLFTLFSMNKIWAGVFWGERGGAVPSPPAGRARLLVPAQMTIGTAVLVGVTVAVALFAGPLYDLSSQAAEGLLDPAAYVQAVLGR
ncbi:MAG: Na+/H+ antiporter subunit D [Acidimicrobiales bacterium]|nr:Na+/H+ antiporter subunit D [Acidimicrobiales bacterium]